MSQIELLCPECGEPLEVDDGFAGGVCRCSTCGTLMSVPDDGEPVAHAARPDDPATPPATASPQPRKGKNVSAPKKSTGRKKKRKKNSAALAAIVFPAMMLMLLLAGWAVYKVMNDTPPADHSALFAYDRNASPHTLPEANVLGLPLASRSALIIDASQDSADWYALMQQALVSGLKRPDRAKELFIVIATADGVETLGGSPAPIAEMASGKLESFLAEHPAAGTADLAAAAKRAGKESVDQFIFITGREIPDDEAAGILDGVASREAALIDAVLIDGDSVALDDLVIKRGGTFTNIKTRDLEDWAFEAESME